MVPLPDKMAELSHRAIYFYGFQKKKFEFFGKFFLWPLLRIEDRNKQ